eukprot:CAMPEP_0113617376 /NCGR_PEP_ID=MMETSP0017_2-20120614/8747_1 /TAXON_ID=2856 /ORGANISM="Cylindrotheca closterium" /LENGTH=371 /DNA_ID=CAMNT_0000526767 /DNA_START=34 /DNA_END=1152 /DNA_ORIENTATION=+ /assembly_acc=CAM_ASM_000147
MKFLASIVPLLALSTVEAHKNLEEKRVKHVKSRANVRHSNVRHSKPRTDDGPSLIVGGTGASAGDFPYYVDLNGCGGSLIAPGVVLTAAHCAPDGFNYEGSTVIIGGLSRQSSSGAQTATVAKQVMHPNWKPETFNTDVMLLKLDSAVTPSGGSLVLNRDAYTPLFSGDTLTVCGVGATSEGGYASDTLLYVDLPFVEFDTCNEKYGNGLDSDVMMCAGGIGGKDSCQGDSGGPIVQRNGNTHTQVGVVSFGEGCARPDIPGVYASTAGTIDWIAYVVCNCWGIDNAGFCSAAGSGFSCPGGGSGSGSTSAPSGAPTGGGDSSEDCTDTPGWTDSVGDGCDWYGDEESYGDPVCEWYADEGAPEHCCVCQD